MKETSAHEQKTRTARLRISVREAAGALQAHAWVECGGTAIDARDAANARFAPLAVVETTALKYM